MPKMECIILGEECLIDTDQLQEDLRDDNCVLVCISKHGELVIDNMEHGEDYPYKREVWQMRPPGEGINNTIWGHQPFEFCRSIKMEPSRGTFLKNME